MRTMGRIASGCVVVVAFLVLAACGDESGQAVSTDSTGTVAGQLQGTVAPLPNRPVCEVFSKEDVQRVIGRSVYSASEVGFLNGVNEPTTCCYYTGPDKSNNIGIQWMLQKDALWNDQIASLRATYNSGTNTQRVRYSGLGDDAIKETARYENVTAVGYAVLLEQRGIVVYVSNTSDASLVPDSAQLKLVRMVIETVKKL